MYLNFFWGNLGGTTQLSIKIYLQTNSTVFLNFHVLLHAIWKKWVCVFFLFHKTSTKFLRGLKQWNNHRLHAARSEDFLSGSNNKDASVQCHVYCIVLHTTRLKVSQQHKWGILWLAGPKLDCLQILSATHFERGASVDFLPQLSSKAFSPIRNWLCDQTHKGGKQKYINFVGFQNMCNFLRPPATVFKGFLAHQKLAKAMWPDP